LNEKQLSILINIKYYLKNNWHVGCFFAIRTARDGAFRDQTVAFRVIFESSRQPLHPRRHVWLADLWFSVSGIFFFITFFSFSSINAPNPPSFQNNPSIFFLDLVHVLLITIFLFEIIFYIGFFFNFIILQFFLFVRFCPYSFFCYLFYWRSFLKLNIFLRFHPPLFFSPIKFDPYYFYCYFFNLINFLNWYFFLISSFNVKLIGNWFYWLSLGLGFLSSPFSVWYWQLVFYIWLLSFFYSLL
jgi:hypothetical protein